MLNPGLKFLKAIVALGVAVLVFQYADQVKTVEVTMVTDAGIQAVPVRADDPIYRDEIATAQNKALPFYGIAIIAGVIGLTMLHSSYRIYTRTRAT